MHWMWNTPLLLQGQVIPKIDVDNQTCQKRDWKTHHARECKYLRLNTSTPPILLRAVMRLVNLYAGDEKNLAFAEDIAKLLSHVDEVEESDRWEAVEQISHGISSLTAAGGGKPLSADGIRGIQQLICKVFPLFEICVDTSS